MSKYTYCNFHTFGQVFDVCGKVKLPLRPMCGPYKYVLSGGKKLQIEDAGKHCNG